MQALTGRARCLSDVAVVSGAILRPSWRSRIPARRERRSRSQPGILPLIRLGYGLRETIRQLPDEDAIPSQWRIEAAGVLSLKTQSPSTVRWRLGVEVRHTWRFAITVTSGTSLGLMDSRRYRGGARIVVRGGRIYSCAFAVRAYSATSPPWSDQRITSKPYPRATHSQNRLASPTVLAVLSTA